MPELERLLGGDLDVELTSVQQRRGAHALDRLERRDRPIDGRIVIHGGPEEGQHPGVDAVQTVVTDPVRDAGARNGGTEAIRVRNRPHHHEAAVAVPVDAETVLIDAVSYTHLRAHE